MRLGTEECNDINKKSGIMNEEEFILLSEEDRNELKKAYQIIKGVRDKISIDYEEFFAINTTLDYLNNAINYKQKFLS